MLFALLFIEPVILFGLTGGIVPQLRYFGGILSVIVILTAIIFNELNKTNFKYFILIFLALNIYAVSDNLIKIYKSNNVLKAKHTFINFNQNIKIDRSKVLYLVDLNFQESLKQNLYYLKLYENNLITKTNTSKKIIKDIKNKVNKIYSSKNIMINNESLKKDITYFNYTYFPIDNFELFFDYINDDFDYIVIEESSPFYLSDKALQNEIKNFVKENLLFKLIQFEEDNIFLRSQQSIIHYYANTLSQYDYAEKIDNNKLEVIYGTNFSLYELQ